MKLLRTIRLDPSDTFIFERAAEPGEWAVSGVFAFWHRDPAALEEARRKCEACLAQGPFDCAQVRREFDPQRFQHVRRAGFGTHRPIAVLGDWHAAAGHNKRHGGGNI